MKNLYVTIGIFLLTFQWANAQELTLGVTVTPTLSFTASDNQDVESDGSKLGILYGLMADFQFSDNENYSVFTGFNIHHTGAKFISRDASYNVAATFIQFPAIFKLQTNVVNNRNFYGQFGFNLGLPISNKVKEGLEANVDVGGIFLAVNIGAGTHIELQDDGVALNLGIFFDNGFTNIFEIEGEKFRIKHLGFRAGIYF